MKYPRKKKKKLLEQYDIHELVIMRTGLGNNGSLTACRILASDKFSLSTFETREVMDSISFTRSLEIHAQSIAISIAEKRTQLIERLIESYKT